MLYSQTGMTNNTLYNTAVIKISYQKKLYDKIILKTIP